MKKVFILTIAALSMMAGCQKINSIIKPGNEPIDDESPVKIQFRSNVLNVTTKASLEGLNGGQDLYIYGLNRTKPGVGEIINAKAHMAKPSGAAEGWSVTDGSLKFADNKTFFYNATKDKYDFYGYYLADAAEIPTKLDNYQIDITINGTQDILLAAADPEKDILAEGVNTTQVTSTEYVYSAWATRRGVTPKLEFRHVLSKFEFEVQNKGTQPVVIQSIDLTTKTNGVLTVINQEPSAEGANDGLVQGLVIKPGDEVTTMRLQSESFLEGGALLDPKDEGTADDVMIDGVRLEGNMSEPTVLQGEIMTFAGQDSDVIIRLVQKGMKENQVRQVTMPITLDEENNKGTKTQEGYKYLVSIVIYSLEEVGVDVQLLGWNSGGKVELDQDDKIDDPESGYEDVIIGGDVNDNESNDDTNEDSGETPGDNTGSEPGDNNGDESTEEPEDDPVQNPEDNTGGEPGDEPGNDSGETPEDNNGGESGETPGENPEDNPGDDPVENPEENTGGEPEPDPTPDPGQEPEPDPTPDPEPDQNPDSEPEEGTEDVTGEDNEVDPEEGLQ